MDNEKSRKAYKKNILEETLNILAATGEEYEKHGDPKSDLRDAPEYLLGVDVARGLAHAFPALKYRLEHHVKTFLNTSKKPVKESEKASTRFDIVLFDKQTQVPRYVMELKRGPNIHQDAKRLLRIAAMDHGRPRWNHGFIVTIVRRSEEEAAKLVKKIEKKLLDETLTSEHEGRRISIKSAYRRIGNSRLKAPGQAIFALAFQISLGVSDEPDAVS